MAQWTVAATLYLGAQREAGKSGAASTQFGDQDFRRPWLLALISVAVVSFVMFIHFTVSRVSPVSFQLALHTSWAGLFFAAIGSVLLAPVAEELFFRGWMWSAIRRVSSAKAAMATTFAVFLLMHFVDTLPVGVIPATARSILLIPVALGLTLVRRFCGSLRACMFLHLANNLTSVAAPFAAVWLGWLSA